MLIKTIELEGYSSYKNYVKVQVPTGVIGIFGEFNGQSDQSNAAGKTSLVTSILYALYGEGEFDKIEELKNDNSDIMMVRITFELNMLSYTIERGIDKSKSYLILMQGDVRIGDSIASTQEAINALLGMDYTMLSTSIFFEQGNMDKFINAPAETRKKHVDKVIGNDVWTSLYKTNSKDLKDLLSAIETKQTESSKYTKQISDNETFLETKSSTEISIQEIKEQIKEKNTLLKSYNINNDSARLDELLQQKESIKKQIDDINRQQKSAQEIIDNPIDYQALISETEAHCTSLDKALVEYEEALASHKADSTTYSDSISQNESVLIKLQVQHDNAAADLLDVSEGVCSKCQQPIDLQQRSEHNTKLQQDIDSLHSQIVDIKLKISGAKTSLQQINTIITTINSNITSNKNLLAQYKNKLVELKTSMGHYTTSIQNAQQQLSHLSSSLLTLTTSLTTVENKINIVQASLANNIEQQKIIDDLQQEITTLESTLVPLYQHLGKIESIQGIQNTLQSQYAEVTQVLSDLTTEQELLTVAVQAFKEIPRQIFNKSIQDVELLANSYIQQLYPHVAVKFYEDTAKKNMPLVIACMVDNKYRSYKRLSGGQRTIVNIGLRLGFSKILMSRAKTQLNFLVMDEPFGALDAKNREDIKKILTLLSDQFQQILIITHTEDVSDFPNIIKVKMSQDFCSYI